MIANCTYILYLEKANDEYYIPLATVLGKVPLDKSEINKDNKIVENDMLYITSRNKRPL